MKREIILKRTWHRRTFIGRQEFTERRGFTILEVMVSLFLVMACIVGMAQLRTTQVSSQQRLDEVEIAQGQLLNVMELLRPVSHDALISDDFSREEMNHLVARSLPGGRLEFEVVPLVFESTEAGIETGIEPITLHRMRATLFWDDGPNRPARSLALDKVLP